MKIEDQLAIARANHNAAKADAEGLLSYNKELRKEIESLRARLAESEAKYKQLARMANEGAHAWIRRMERRAHAAEADRDRWQEAAFKEQAFAVQLAGELQESREEAVRLREVLTRLDQEIPHGGEGWAGKQERQVASVLTDYIRDFIDEALTSTPLTGKLVCLIEALGALCQVEDEYENQTYYREDDGTSLEGDIQERRIEAFQAVLDVFRKYKEEEK